MSWKLFASMIALVLIGFVAGFYTNRYMTKQTVRKIAVLRQAKGMEDRLYKILRLDDAQKAKLEPVIKKHFENLEQINKENRSKRVKMADTLKAILAPDLTETQYKGLNRYIERLKRPLRNGKRKMRKKQPANKKSN